jgi:hypothetical protein
LKKLEALSEEETGLYLLGFVGYLRTLTKKVNPPAIRAIPMMTCVMKWPGPPNTAAKGEPNRTKRPSPIKIIPKKIFRKVPISNSNIGMVEGQHSQKVGSLRLKWIENWVVGQFGI